MDRWTKFVTVGAIGLALTAGTAISMAHPHEGSREQRRENRQKELRKEHRGGDHRKHDQKRDRHARPMQELGKIIRDLNLDEAQRDAVREIVRDSRKEGRRIFEETSDPKQRQQDLQALAERVHGDIEAKLNDEQKAKFRTAVDQLRERRQQEREAARFPMIKRLGDVLGRMDLSDEQRTQIDELLKGTRERVDAMRAEAGDQPASKDSFRQLIQETHEKLGAILTPEQRDQLRKRMNPRHEDRRHDRQDRKHDRHDRKHDRHDRRDQHRRDHDRRDEHRQDHRRQHRPMPIRVV